MPEVAERVAANLVTSENHDAFVAKRLGLEPPPEPKKETPKVEKAEEKKDAQPAAHVDDPEQEPDADVKPIRKGNPKIEKRFSELTNARKAAEKRAEENAAEVVREREARMAAEQRAAELDAKLNPPKADDLGPKPKPEQFTNTTEFAAALEDWTAENTRREDAQKEAERSYKEQREKLTQVWNERQDAIRKEIPDYDARLKKSTGMVSDPVRDAIFDSEVGPRILLHLADNPAEVERIGKLTIGAALREIGKLEVKLAAGGTASPSSKSSSDAGADTASARSSGSAEISRAPAPISPLKGGNAVADGPVDSQGVFHGTYAEYKAARKAGKIK